MLKFLFIFLAVLLQSSQTESERLRELMKDVPDLSLERVEVKAEGPLTFVGVSAVTSDGKGNLYVLHRPATGDPVVVLDRKGKFIRSWGAGMYMMPHGIRIDPAGNVWTIDAHTSMVYKFSPLGKRLLTIDVGDVPDPMQEFCGATDIAFGAKRHLFVSDGYCNARIIEYDGRGRKVRQWGTKGSGPGEFDKVHSIAIGPDRNIYVADRENGRVQRFTQQGKFLGQWTYGGQVYAVAFSPTGELFASIHPKGLSLDEQFNVVKIDVASGRLLGKFPVRAHEIAFASDGTLLPASRNDQIVALRDRR
ncbi:MAG TPA: peptidyl-alpha-hydroxyglycine alpha-amidating lyase family protein [Terriglobales bacterium]|nr:peptidyl-alpha-hydroxyglycine alpha-amidating lyase family protein [Terriglobales bacterium]